MRINRRTFLKWAGAAAIAAPFGVSAAPRKPPSYTTLQNQILETIGGQAIGFDLRALTPDGLEAFRIEHQADEWYPVASCFKAFVVLYYFWHTPPELWTTDRYSPVYRVGVFSDNIMVGTVLKDVAEYVNVYGNPIEKFNDFLLFNVGLENGLHTWKWEGNPVEFEADRRFAPSDKRRITVYGASHRIDNLFTPTDLVTGYNFMMKTAALEAPQTVMTTLPSFDSERAAASAQAALDLLSIPARNYESPFERVGFSGYTGKDGILPQGDISAGNVVADAGIIPIGTQRFLIAYMSVGQSEYSAINTLQTIADSIREYAL